jgi:hypothetical protein
MLHCAQDYQKRNKGHRIRKRMHGRRYATKILILIAEFCAISNFTVGFMVPMPTLPFVLMRIASALLAILLVLITNGGLSIVPMRDKESTLSQTVAVRCH